MEAKEKVSKTSLELKIDSEPTGMISFSFEKP